MATLTAPRPGSIAEAPASELFSDVNFDGILVLIKEVGEKPRLQVIAPNTTAYEEITGGEIDAFSVPGTERHDVVGICKKGGRTYRQDKNIPINFPIPSMAMGITSNAFFAIDQDYGDLSSLTKAAIILICASFKWEVPESEKPK